MVILTHLLLALISHKEQLWQAGSRFPLLQKLEYQYIHMLAILYEALKK
jgi:hypothetical protein